MGNSNTTNNRLLHRMDGTYALILHCLNQQSIETARLGKMSLRKGFYAYVGSAFGSGGLLARIKHHCRISKSPHWHIDYLRPAMEITEVWYSYVYELNVDLLSLSGAALGGPKGIGALYFRNKLRLMPLIHGGIQENGRRAGTENVPGIVGLGKAAELAKEELSDKETHLRKLRDLLVTGIIDRVEKIKFTGHPDKRLP